MFERYRLSSILKSVNCHHPIIDFKPMKPLCLTISILLDCVFIDVLIINCEILVWELESGFSFDLWAILALEPVQNSELSLNERINRKFKFFKDVLGASELPCHSKNSTLQCPKNPKALDRRFWPSKKLPCAATSVARNPKVENNWSVVCHVLHPTTHYWSRVNITTSPLTCLATTHQPFILCHVFILPD